MSASIAGILLLPAASLGVEAVDPAARIGPGNPELGRIKADDSRCLECHGIEGMSGDARIPNHAGQFAAYLIKQLRDFQSGARHHEVMNLMAEDLSAGDMADIAAYFASLPVMSGPRIGDFPEAEKLFERGDAGRNIPACAGCHGNDGKGGRDEHGVYPLIAGQNRVYLHSQLTGWKHEGRSNSPDAVMNKIAGALRDDEIDALANYLSGR
nr:c-type cytochrome [Methylomonas sp. SURF-2]